MDIRKRLAGVVLLACCYLFLLTGISAAISPEELTRIEAAVPAKAVAVPKQPRKLLLFNLCNDYKHSSIPYFDKALQIMGQKTGAYTATISNDMSVFGPQSLGQFDAVCFNNTTKLGFSDPKLRESLMAFIRGGKGIIGIHAATDNFYNWPEAAEMMGGQFCGHPWGAGGTWAVKIDDPQHPLTAVFGGKGFKTKTEIYRTKLPFYSRLNQRVLLSLDMSDQATRSVKGLEPGDSDIGISWVKSYGKGRLFYCSLGHNKELTWNVTLLKHYLAGIQFALGDLSVDTTPSFDKNLAAIAVYEYGQSRLPLAAMNEYLRSVYTSPETLKRIEKRFLDLLGSDATPAGKQFICRKLSIIGTEESVPALAAMLTEKSTSKIQPADMARYALERIPGKAAGKALRDALGKTAGQVKVGIINSIGQRDDRKATKQLVGLLSDSDEDIVEASMSALGRIGSRRAAEALGKARPNRDSRLYRVWADAYLSCADSFLARGKTELAQPIYRRMYAESESGPVRFAALRGMVGAEPKGSIGIVIGALESKDEALRSVAVGLLRQIPGTEAIEAVIVRFPNLSVLGQVQVLSVLADRGQGIALPTVLAAAGSGEVEVRIAAYSALSKLGDASCVNLLAEAAASKEGPERDAARQGLYRLRGRGVDGRIMAGMGRPDPRFKVELIRAVGERNIAAGVETLLKSAKAPQLEVRLESLRVLGDIAGPGHLPALVKLLLEAKSPAERSVAEDTVAAVARKIEDKDRQADSVFDALGSAGSFQAKASLLSVLGKLGGSKALDALRAALQDKDEKVQSAAIRGLSNWPDHEPVEQLLKVAESSGSKRHRVLALRGFVRLLGLKSERPAEQTLKLYQRAMELASDAGEKKMVLSGLARMRSFASLQMAAGYLGDEVLRREAEAAVVSIAKGTYGREPQQTRAVLAEVLRGSQNDSVRKQAQELIKRIEQFAFYITDWQVSGPYSRKGAGALELFDVAFAPEQGEGKNAQWRIMPSGTDSDKPWLLDLSKAIGGSDRAAYLVTSVWSPKQQKARLLVGSDDGVKIWLNKQLVHSKNVERGLKQGQDKIEVTLRNGWNKLMMKIIQGGGDWSACASLVSLDGGTLPGLNVSARSGAETELIGDDFSSWRDNTGDWRIVGEAIMDPKKNKLIATKPGRGIIVNGADGKTVNIFSKAEFGDVAAHIEFVVPRGSNSGVYFMGRYEIQVLDSWGVQHPKHSDCGGIYQRWDPKRTPHGFEGKGPRVNASLPPGQWQSYDVIFQAPRFDAGGRKVANARFEKVIHNGIVVHEDSEVTGPTRAGAFQDEKPTGPLMLQGDHGPVAYRNIWILPLDKNQP